MNLRDFMKAKLSGGSSEILGEITITENGTYVPGIREPKAGEVVALKSEFTEEDIAFLDSIAGEEVSLGIMLQNDPPVFFQYGTDSTGIHICYGDMDMQYWYNEPNAPNKWIDASTYRILNGYLGTELVDEPHQIISHLMAKDKPFIPTGVKCKIKETLNQNELLKFYPAVLISFKPNAIIDGQEASFDITTARKTFTHGGILITINQAQIDYYYLFSEDDPIIKETQDAPSFSNTYPYEGEGWYYHDKTNNALRKTVPNHEITLMDCVNQYDMMYAYGASQHWLATILEPIDKATAYNKVIVNVSK